MAKKQQTSDASKNEVFMENVEPLTLQTDYKKKFFFWPLVIIFSLGFLLYVQTVNYQYALDDKLVITHNYITKKGIKGIKEHLQTDFLVGFFGKQKNLLEGGRYRPLSLISFSIENELFGKKLQNDKGQFVVDKDGDQIYEYDPFWGHFFNALYYAVICVVLFLILHKLFPPDKSKPWYLSFPLIVTLIYATHPLHTEAVANIKGRDELMSLLGGLGALLFSVNYAKDRGIHNLILSGICMFLALMSKEGIVTFVAVVPLTILYFTKEKWKDIFIATLPLLVMTGVYIAIRFKVLGGARTSDTLIPELMNMPFMYTEDKAIQMDRFPYLQKNGPSYWPSIMYTLGYYIKLLFVPHPLTHDYYPWHPLGEFIYNNNLSVDRQAYPYLKWADPRAFLSLLIYLGMAIYAIKDFIKIVLGKTKEKSIVSYCILFYLGTLFLVSNIPFQVGTFLNERFMFIPSIAFAMLVGHFLLNWLPKKMKTVQEHQKFVTAFMAIVLVLFSLKTVSRNTSWENDFALSVGDVEVSYNSAKSNMSAGLALVDESKKYKVPLTTLPEGHVLIGDSATALATLNQQRKAEHASMIERAIKHLSLSLNIYPTYIQPMLIMGNAYYEKEDYNNAIVYFEKCLKLNRTYEYAVKNLEHVGDLCVKNKDYETGVKSYETLLRYDNTNQQRIGAKLAQAYSNAGNIGNAKQYLTNEVERLKQELAKNPNDLGILVKLGEYYGKNLNDLQNSKLYLEKALEVAPDNADVMQKLGVVYAMGGNPAAAIDMFKRALEKNPSNAHILMNIGIAYRNMGDEANALQYLNKAFELDPSLRGR